MKVREEHETPAADGDVLIRILRELGFDVCFTYEKRREEYAADGVTIAIDDTPIGTFVELEGDESGILRLTRALGRTPQDFILGSYRRLFVARREELGIPGNDMVFSGQ
jgi:adenylate cyclase class 2